jgi:hypothetical protein
MPHKRRDEWMRRPVINLIRRAVLKNFSRVHHHHRVGDSKRFFLIVGDVAAR